MNIANVAISTAALRFESVKVAPETGPLDQFVQKPTYTVVFDDMVV